MFISIRQHKAQKAAGFLIYVNQAPRRPVFSDLEQAYTAVARVNTLEPFADRRNDPPQLRPTIGVTRTESLLVKEH